MFDLLSVRPVVLVLATVAVGIAVSTVPFVVSAIDYRHRDNGLAYLLLVLGVGVWNGMYATQLLTADPLVEGFFFALSVVGSVLAGLGFLLFATTASSTPDSLDRREVYAAVGVLGGIDIVLAVTTPAHGLYWQVRPGASAALEFASIAPGIGQWLHTLFLMALIGGGVFVFADARRQDPANHYLTVYVVAGSLTALGALASTIVAPGGIAFGAVLGGGLTATAWLQATRRRPLRIVRDRGRRIRASIQGFRGAP